MMVGELMFFFRSTLSLMLNTYSLNDFIGGGSIFAAGCSDGSIRVFDRRLPSNNCRTITYREHNACIITAKIRKCSDLLVAGW